jgi:phosphohistidine phosphatase SixA
MLLKMLVAGLAAIAVLLAPSGTALAAGHDAGSGRHIYVMRHLHKDTGEDPPLSQEGASLARLLAGHFASFGIEAVFATPTRRAIQTGEPLARLLGLPVTVYDPGDIAALACAIEAAPGNILVVGHSNTVPDLVAAFGGAKPEPLSEDDYGTIYQVTIGSPAVRLFHVPPVPIPALTSPPGER